MRIVWFSNHPHIGTGYGVQTDLATSVLAAAHEVVVVDNCAGAGHVPTRINDNRLVVAGGGGDARDVALIDWIPHFAPDAVVGLFDAWALNVEVWRQIAENVPAMVWAPIDSWPLGRNRPFFEQTKVRPLPMSQFGHRMCTEAGLDPLDTVPHGVDLDTFKPTPSQEVRRLMTGDHPDAFLVGMVAMNKDAGLPRKGWAPALQAFKALLADRPDARLYLHGATGPEMGGMDLRVLIDQIGLPHEHVAQPDRLVHVRPLEPARMAEIYSSMDVLLAPSMGEGFCVPLIEAQACGTPVIATAATAQTELIGCGLPVSEGLDWWHGPLQGWYRHADWRQIAEHLRTVASRPQMPDPSAVDFARQFDHRRVAGMIEDRITEITA